MRIYQDNIEPVSDNAQRRVALASPGKGGTMSSPPEYPHWPVDWPGRRFVNLDCVGDPGSWLDLELPSEEEVLTQDPEADEGTAEALADAYISKGQQLCFPLPTDLGVSFESMRKVAVADFVGFIREWRKRARAAGCFDQKQGADDDFISLWDLLSILGFLPDPGVWSDPPPGLSCRIGGGAISASRVRSERLQQVVLITGVLVSPRGVAEINFEMPRKVESRQQALAWLVWGLDSAADGGRFAPGVPIWWLEEGRQHRGTLPWERERLAYAARPHCFLEREWARLALKTLADQIRIAARLTSEAIWSGVIAADTSTTAITPAATGTVPNVTASRPKRGWTSSKLVCCRWPIIF